MHCTVTSTTMSDLSWQLKTVTTQTTPDNVGKQLKQVYLYNHVTYQRGQMHLLSSNNKRQWHQKRGKQLLGRENSTMTYTI